MTSRLQELIACAADQLEHTGSVSHFFTDCTNAGVVNALPDRHGTTCVACEINAAAKVLDDAIGADSGRTPAGEES